MEVCSEGIAGGDIRVEIDQLCLRKPEELISRSEINLPVVESPRNVKEANNTSKKPISLQTCDFLGPSDAIKDLILLINKESTAPSPPLALHRMGNVLLIDSVPHNLNYSQSTDISQQLDSNETGESIAGFLSSDSTGLLIEEGTNKENKLSRNDLVTHSSVLPPSPSACRNIVTWEVQDMHLKLGCDLNIIHAPDNRVVALKSLDISENLEMSTCLDMYLDNILASVPELAIALHSKGLVRGVKIIDTKDIPYLNSTELRDLNDYISPNNIAINKNFFSSFVLSNAEASLDLDLLSSSRSRQGSIDSFSKGMPMFDPNDINFDAAAILRFLKDNCRKEDGTYILQKSASGRYLHLYDLNSATLVKQKKFKWLLAMISYRFAVRLGQHFHLVNKTDRCIMIGQQRRLFTNCLELLDELVRLGGEDHKTIRASVFDQLADIHLSRIRVKNRLSKNKYFEEKKTDDRCNVDDDDEDVDDDYFDFEAECSDSLSYLRKSLESLYDMLESQVSNNDLDESQDESNDDLPNENRNSGNNANKEDQFLDDLDNIGSSLFSTNDSLDFDIADPQEIQNNLDDEIEEKGTRLSMLVQLLVQHSKILSKIIQTSLWLTNYMRSLAKRGDAWQALRAALRLCEGWSKYKETVNRWNDTLVELERTKNMQGRGSTSKKNSESKSGKWRFDSELKTIDLCISQHLFALWSALGELSMDTLNNKDATFLDIAAKSSNSVVNGLEKLQESNLESMMILQKLSYAIFGAKDSRTHYDSLSNANFFYMNYEKLGKNEKRKRNSTYARYFESIEQRTDSSVINMTSWTNRDTGKGTGKGAKKEKLQKLNFSEVDTKGNSFWNAFLYVHNLVYPVIDSKVHLLGLAQLIAMFKKCSGERDKLLTVLLSFVGEDYEAISSILKVDDPKFQSLKGEIFNPIEEIFALSLICFTFVHAINSRHYFLSVIEKDDGVSTSGVSYIFDQRDNLVNDCFRKLGDLLSKISQQMLIVVQNFLLTISRNISVVSSENNTIQTLVMRIKNYLDFIFKVYENIRDIFALIEDHVNRITISCNISTVYRLKTHVEAILFRLNSINKSGQVSKEACLCDNIIMLNQATEVCESSLASILEIESSIVDNNSSNKNNQFEKNLSAKHKASMLWYCISNVKQELCNGLMSKVMLYRILIFEHRFDNIHYSLYNEIFLKPYQLFIESYCSERGNDTGIGSEPPHCISHSQEMMNAVYNSLLRSIKLYSENNTSRMKAHAEFMLGSYCYDVMLHRHNNFISSNNTPSSKVKGKKEMAAICPPIENSFDIMSIDDSSLLSNSLQLYNSSFQYFSKQNIGPHMLAILIDICDWYLNSYKSEMSEFNMKKNLRKNNNLLVARSDSSEPSSPLSPQTEGLDSLPSLSRLGGALGSLLKGRCTLTLAVQQLHGSSLRRLQVPLVNRLRDTVKLLLRATRSNEEIPITPTGDDNLNLLKMSFKELLECRTGDDANSSTDHKDVFAICLGVMESLQQSPWIQDIVSEANM